MSTKHNESLTAGNIVIGVIGGSGLYSMDGFKSAEEISLTTPYGAPSAPLVVGEMYGIKTIFLARHGRHHHLLPSEIPYQANIYALKKMGVTHILAVSAVGSLREEMPPRDLVVVDQYMDFTKNRTSTFFGGGLVAHVSMARPTCKNLSTIMYNCASSILENSNENIHSCGTYLCMEGPQFSSLAESLRYKFLGADVIGMTNMPEAKLAREAQIAYAPLCMITDYDCWHGVDDEVNVHMLLDNLRACAENARKIVAATIEQVSIQKPCSIAHHALETAVYSPYDSLSTEKKELLDFLRGA